MKWTDHAEQGYSQADCGPFTLLADRSTKGCYALVDCQGQRVHSAYFPDADYVDSVNAARMECELWVTDQMVQMVRDLAQR